jgi:hypothetical protein
MFNAADIARLHDQTTAAWHLKPSPEAPTRAIEPLLVLIEGQHRANFDLWHEEDSARCPDVSDACIATVKHAIDRLNQQRNDLVEQIDLALLEHAGTQNEDAPLHSETPGLIVDRLSILALKIYHTKLEANRESASDAHRLRNCERLHILEQQRNDLATCLDQLWRQIVHGERRFRLYRQMKMYNDPDLNPAIYEHTK